MNWPVCEKTSFDHEQIPFFGRFRFLSGCDRGEQLKTFYGIVARVIDELRTLATNVTDMPRIVFNDRFLNKNSPTADIWHSYFDVQWTLIELSYMAAELGGESCSSGPLREQLAGVSSQMQQRLCADLIYAACRQFSNVKPFDDVNR